MCVCGLSLLKSRRLRVLLHSVPVYAVCRLHDSVRCFGLVVIRAVVPQAVSALTAGFHDAVARVAKDCTFSSAGEGCCNLFGFGGAAGKPGRIVEGVSALTAGHLIPGAAVSGSYNGVRSGGFSNCAVLNISTLLTFPSVPVAVVLICPPLIWVPLSVWPAS